MLNPILFVAALAVVLPQSSDLPSSPDAIPIPALTEYSPPKPVHDQIEGAPFLLLQDKTLPLVDGLLIFEAGSLREPSELTGLAELFAGSLREGGSAAFTGDELNLWLDAHAVELSIESTENQLRISFNCLSEDLTALIKKLGQLVSTPAFSQQSIELVRMKMLTKIKRAKDDAGQLADDASNRLLFGEHSPFGRRPSEESVTKITRQDLVHFGTKHLGIDRLHIGLSGDFDPSAAKSLFKASFGGLAKLGPAPALPEPTFSPIQGTTIFVIDRPGVPQTELRIVSPGLWAGDPEQPALTLWSYVVGRGGMTNRLMSEVRTKLGLAYGVGSNFSSGLQRRGRFSAFCATRNDAVGEALSAMLELIIESAYFRIPPAELEAARSRLLAGQVFRSDSSSKILGRALALEFAGLADDFWEQNFKRYETIKTDEVLAASKRHISPTRFICVAVGPAEEIVPSLSTVASIVRLDRPKSIVDATSKVDAMLKALGGREAWAKLRSVHLKHLVTTEYARGTTQVPVEQWRRFEPLSIRSKQRTPAGMTFINIVNPNKGWLKGPIGSTRLDSDDLSIWQNELELWLYYNLHRLAANSGDLEVSLGENGRLNLFNSTGQIAWIELGEDNRPVAMGTTTNQVERLYRYKNWTEVDGIYYSKTFIEDRKSVEVELFDPNVDLADHLFSL